MTISLYFTHTRQPSYRDYLKELLSRNGVLKLNTFCVISFLVILFHTVCDTHLRGLRLSPWRLTRWTDALSERNIQSLIRKGSFKENTYFINKFGTRVRVSWSKDGCIRPEHHPSLGSTSNRLLHKNPLLFCRLYVCVYQDYISDVIPTENRNWKEPHLKMKVSISDVVCRPRPLMQVKVGHQVRLPPSALVCVCGCRPFAPEYPDPARDPLRTVPDVHVVDRSARFRVHMCAHTHTVSGNRRLCYVSVYSDYNCCWGQTGDWVVEVRAVLFESLKEPLLYLSSSLIQSEVPPSPVVKGSVKITGRSPEP